MASELGLHEVYRLPLYTQPEAARIVEVPVPTLRNWARGYAYKTLSGIVQAFPMITTEQVTNPRSPSIPFLGLAEAYVLSAFREAGVPMQRIRPAIHWLDRNIGLPAALASERLKTDGAEILYDFSRQAPGDNPEAARAAEELVVVRNQQRVFVPVVSNYLRTLTYRHGYIENIRLPQFQLVEVIVDPRLNSGRPTIASRGVRVSDVRSRLAAGETVGEVADDYRLRPAEVEALL